ncbi:MAG: Mechanosensitive ion channel family protein [Nitrospira sp.]|nr:MAG: Mechanosensitive ion channel family protein [Nitrospira sp.]
MNSMIESEYWGVVLNLWEHGYWGIDVRRVVLAAAIMTLGILIRKPFSRMLLRQFQFVLIHVHHKGDTKILEALAPPFRLVSVLLAAFVVSEFVIVHPQLKLIAEDANRSLIAFTLFWALFQLVAPLLSAINERDEAFSDVIMEWMVRVLRTLLLALGVATVLEIWGIRVGTILAGLGLVGAAVALGAQALFKNLIAGVFIIAERRLQHGDWIRVDGVVEGTVESIGLRTTMVRRFDLAPVYVPNSQLADTAVTNFSQMTARQISWTIGLEYGTSIDQLRRIRDGIERYILDSRDFIQTPAAPMLVRIDSFGDSAINLMVYCFTRSTDWAEWMKIKEALAYAIKTLVAEAGSGFAFPSQSVYVETVPSGAEVASLQRPLSAPSTPDPASSRPPA